MSDLLEELKQVGMERRLAALEADPTLRHSGARWRAHAALYPGKGAEEAAARYAARDREKLAQVDAAVADWLANAPDDEETIGYLLWLCEELRGGDGDGG